MPSVLTDTPPSPGPSLAAAPIAAVDELEIAEAGEGAGAGGAAFTATKAVVRDDPYMPGHFPELTIYPGVFALETVAQAAAVAIGAPLQIAAVRSMRFVAPVCAGDRLVVDASWRAAEHPDTWSVDARCRRADGTETARVAIDVRRRTPHDA